MGPACLSGGGTPLLDRLARWRALAGSPLHCAGLLIIGDTCHAFHHSAAVAWLLLSCSCLLHEHHMACAL